MCTHTITTTITCLPVDFVSPLSPSLSLSRFFSLSSSLSPSSPTAAATPVVKVYVRVEKKIEDPASIFFLHLVYAEREISMHTDRPS